MSSSAEKSSSPWRRVPHPFVYIRKGETLDKRGLGEKLRFSFRNFWRCRAIAPPERVLHHYTGEASRRGGLSTGPPSGGLHRLKELTLPSTRGKGKLY